MNNHKNSADSIYAGVLDRINDPRQLPSLPSLLAELVRSLDDDNADLGTISKRIASDQALVAKILRLANSPFYGMQKHIGSAQEAIVVLGFNQVRSLVVAATLIPSFANVKKAGLEPLPFWRHSLDVAVRARMLLRGREAEIGFTAGLLHDVGKLVVATIAPEAFRRAADEGARSGQVLEAERSVLGADHTFIGAAAGERWRFPKDIIDAIATHHSVVDKTSDIADAVHVAQMWTEHPLSGLVQQPSVRKSLQRLQVSTVELSDVAAKCEAQLSALMALLETA